MTTKDEEALTKIQKAIQKANEAGDVEKALSLLGDMIGAAERTGELTRDAGAQLRIQVATQMIKALHVGNTREKVTLSLRTNVITALRLASAESGKDMSDVVSEALEVELQKYSHAAQALTKSKT